MVKFYDRLKDLNFDALMQVYSEALEENAEEIYPDVDHSEGLLLARQDFYQYLREVFFQINDAFYSVLESDQEYISALRFEPYKDGLLLEAVETAPQHRRKGYAKMLLMQTFSHVRNLGTDKIYSHVSKRNLPSIRLHEACGFTRIADSAVYIDGSVSNRAFTFYREIRNWRSDCIL